MEEDYTKGLRRYVLNSISNSFYLLHDVSTVLETGNSVPIACLLSESEMKCQYATNINAE